MHQCHNIYSPHHVNDVKHLFSIISDFIHMREEEGRIKCSTLLRIYSDIISCAILSISAQHCVHSEWNSQHLDLRKTNYKERAG